MAMMVWSYSNVQTISILVYMSPLDLMFSAQTTDVDVRGFVQLIRCVYLRALVCISVQ